MDDPSEQKDHNPPYWQHDPRLHQRVLLDIRGTYDPGLRDDKLVSWHGMLRALLAQTDNQLSRHRARMAQLEDEYAHGDRSDRALNHLLSQRAEYALWRNRKLAFRAVLLQRLSEARDLLQRAEGHDEQAG